MSINAISSLSLYEYYYQINNDDKEKKKNSPLEKEMREYGLTPTDNEALNIAMLEQAKNIKRQKEANEQEEIPYSQRPWADLMYQLDIPFNPDPKDDIDDIKDELKKLTDGMDDEQLSKEVADLEDYAERMYLNFINNSSSAINNSITITAQLNNLSTLNRAALM